MLKSKIVSKKMKEFGKKSGVIFGVGVSIFILLAVGVYALSPPPDSSNKQTKPVRIIKPITDTDWPMFHKNGTRTGLSRELFIKPPLSVKWVYSTEGNIWASPAVVGNSCFIGSSDGKLYAINVKTGARIWSFQTGDAIYSSPAVSKGYVYVGSLDRKFYAVDARNGKMKWSLKTGDPITTSPCVDNGTVYFGSWDGNVYAVDSSSGNVKWKYQTGGPIYSSPAVYMENVYIGAHDGKVYAINKLTGKVSWVYKTKDYVSSTPCVKDKMVFIGSWDKNMYALNYKTGKLIWKYQADDGIYATPAISNGTIIFASYGGTLYSLNRAKGYEVWKHKAEKSAYHSSPVIANDVVYIGLSYQNKVQAFKLKTGEYLWSHITGSSVGATPAISNTMMFIASSDGKVYAFGDVQAPVAKVILSKKSQSSTKFNVKWSGVDKGGSMIKSFDIQYKAGAGEEWRKWLINTTSSEATFGPMRPMPVRDGTTYYFQARARDNAGNVGYFAGGEGDAYTTIDLSPPVIGKVTIDKVIAKPGMFISPTPVIRAQIDDNVGVDPKRIEIIINDKKYGPEFFSKGIMKYVHKDPLPPGYYVIKLKAWDVSGNLSKKWEMKRLRVSVGVQIENLKVAPNPFNPLAGPTFIYYSLNANANMILYIYDRFGSLIYSRRFKEGASGGGKGYNKIEWKGVTSSKAIVQNGEYTYKLIANDEIVGKGIITVQQ